MSRVPIARRRAVRIAASLAIVALTAVGRTAARAEDAAGVRVDVVDAETGEPLPPGWRWRFVSEDSDPRNPAATDAYDAGRRAQPMVGRDGLTLPALQVLPPPSDGPPRWWLRDLPGKRGWRRATDRGPAELVAIVPVRRVAHLVVRAAPVGEERAPLSTVSWGYVGGGLEHERESTKAQPSLPLEVPYHRGARLIVRAGGKRYGQVEVRLPETHPTDRPLQLDVEVPLIASSPESMEPPFERDEVRTQTKEQGPNILDPKGGVLELLVTTHDKRPLAGAEVSLRSTHIASAGVVDVSATRGDAVTGADGRATLRDLPLGGYFLKVVHADALTIMREIRVEKRGATRLSVNEWKGGTLEVTAVGYGGKPLPFAEVTVKGARGADGSLAPGPARLDPYTDREGRRTFQRLDPGKAKIEARYGPFVGTAEVEVKEGGSVAVRLILEQRS